MLNAVILDILDNPIFNLAMSLLGVLGNAAVYAISLLLSLFDFFNAINVAPQPSLVWPVPGYHHSNSPWGWRTATNSWHRGIDVNHGHVCGHTEAGNHQCGTNCRVPIVAIALGEVYHEGPHAEFGYHIIIEHLNGMHTLYAHLHARSPLRRGQSVEVGQPVGILGNTGRSYGPHLHFELRTSNGLRVNPLQGFHWADHRSGSANPNPLFRCTTCGNSACRGRKTENDGRHHFILNLDFNSDFFTNSNNARWWQTTRRSW